MEKKLTKKEMFQKVLEMVKGEPELETFIEKEIKAIERKSETAKARASKKKDENSELTDLIKSCLSDTEEPMSSVLNKVNALLPTEGKISSQKLASHIGKLIKSGVAVKEEKNIKTEGEKSRRITFYKLA